MGIINSATKITYNTETWKGNTIETQVAQKTVTS